MCVRYGTVRMCVDLGCMVAIGTGRALQAARRAAASARREESRQPGGNQPTPAHRQPAVRETRGYITIAITFAISITITIIIAIIATTTTTTIIITIIIRCIISGTISITIRWSARGRPRARRSRPRWWRRRNMICYDIRYYQIIS